MSQRVDRWREDLATDEGVFMSQDQRKGERRGRQELSSFDDGRQKFGARNRDRQREEDMWILARSKEE